MMPAPCRRGCLAIALLLAAVPARAADLPDRASVEADLAACRETGAIPEPVGPHRAEAVLAGGAGRDPDGFNAHPESLWATGWKADGIHGPDRPPRTASGSARDTGGSGPLPVVDGAWTPYAAARFDFVESSDEAVPELRESGWTLRAVPGSTPVAVANGPGTVRTLALFCLSQRPFLAIVFDPAPAADSAGVRFAFPEAPFETRAIREATAGGAFVISLADLPLTRQLSGRASSVGIVVDGIEQGQLSLKGSTRAIRAALDSCQPV